MNENRRTLWNLAHACENAVLMTQGNDGFIHARTMQTVKNGSHEEIWFATETRERKVTEIAREPKVTVFYSHADHSWACVYGYAEVITDQTLKSRLWNKSWEKYWPDGPVSATYCLIRVKPISAEYLLQAKNERGRVAFKNGDS